MLAHQPLDEARVVVAQQVLAAKIAGILFTERGVIAAAALGDVVEQCAQIQPLGFDQPLHQFAGEWKFMAEFGNAEAAHVTQHEQRVLVHGIDVK